MDIELRHVRYFLAVAEERSFTRAAARVGIGQPPLSMQIRSLETELGAPLFERQARGVALTAAGHAFLPEARALLSQATHAFGAAARGARGEVGRLRIGFTGSAAFDPLVPRALKRFSETYPDVTLAIEEAPTAQLLVRLEEGEVDGAFIRPGPTSPERVSVLRLSEERMVAVLPTSHAAARRKEVALAALAGEAFVLFPRRAGPSLFDGIVAACQRAGFTPRIAHDAPQMASIAMFVAAGLGVSIAPASVAQVQVAGATYVPIAGDAPLAGLAFATRLEEPSIIALNFARIVSARAAPPSRKRAPPSRPA